MIDFTGIKCPVCGVAFKEDDDIVVCPECGAPYHRDCYSEKGSCVFTGLHEAGEEWKPPAAPKPPEPSARVKDKECPVCGCLNDQDAPFCARCGSSLRQAPQDQLPFRGVPPYQGQPRGGAPGQDRVPPSYTPYGQPQGRGYGVPPFVFDPMGGVNPADVLDSGVSYGDASKLVKQNTAYYMPVFRYIRQTGRNKFNFSAFLFSGAWMLYRKQYKWGAVVTALMFLIYLLYLAASVFIASPTLLLLMEEAGMDLAQGFAPSNAQMIIITQRMTEEPSLYLKISLPMICLLLMLVVMIVVGVRGNRMYLKHCVKTVRVVKSADLADEPTMTLDNKGGVNTSIAICMFVCYFLLVNVVPLLL